MITDQITLMEGFHKGKLRYSEEKKAEARLSRGEEFQVNPMKALFTKRDTLNIYGDKVYRKLAFNNSMGSEIVLLKVFHNDTLFQECDESEAKESVSTSYVTGTGFGVVAAPGSVYHPGNDPGYISSKKDVVDADDIDCILKRQYDTVQVEAHDPDGMVSKYRIIRK